MERVHAWSKSCLLCLASKTSFLIVLVSFANGGLSPLEEQAKHYLVELEGKYAGACNRKTTSWWNCVTNLTDKTSKAFAEAETIYFNFQAQVQKEILQRFPNWREFKDERMRRQFRYLAIKGPATMSEEDVTAIKKLEGEMMSDWSTATVCEYKNPSNCTCRLNPEIEHVLQTSTDPDELAHYWTAWHDKTSEKVPPSKYQQFVTLQTLMAKSNGFNDISEIWLAWYDDETRNWTTHKFKDDMKGYWEEVRPMYETLHAYVRMKLRRIPEYKGSIDKCGFIPIHLTGNMWSHHWTRLDKLTKPFPNAPSLDATQAMIKNNYTVLKMFHEADKFFTNMGLLPATDTFWKKSMLERPSDGREVLCHAEAEDFCLGKGSTDFRIKQCARVNMNDLITIHHELGHIQYYQQFKNEPFIFRDAANPGFNEAIGDALALSVVTPKHLQCILNLDLGLDNSLCNCNDNDDDKPFASASGSEVQVTETDINFLYVTALQKLVPFPFAISMESWRWEVLEGKLSPEQYNRRWWELRMENQGIKPPVDRSSPNLFDPAAKFHTVLSQDYIRYFISFILQFQFYEAMCIAAGEFNPESNSSKPLYQCDFAGSKKAGELLGNMMKLGFSKAWPVALEAITGSRRMSISSLKNYFQPLLDYMGKELNANGEMTGFADSCDALITTFQDQDLTLSENTIFRNS